MSPQQLQWLKQVREWGPPIVLLLVLLGAKVSWPGTRLDAFDARLTSVEEVRDVVDAMALSMCLEQTDPIARQRLRCGLREQQAGIRR